MCTIPRSKVPTMRRTLDLLNTLSALRPRLPSSKKLLTVNEVVQLTRLSRVTIYRMVHAGQFQLR
jgi:DNA-binding IclR family transcriptional regulator